VLILGSNLFVPALHSLDFHHGDIKGNNLVLMDPNATFGPLSAIDFARAIKAILSREVQPEPCNPASRTPEAILGKEYFFHVRNSLTWFLQGSRFRRRMLIGGL
jgi:hypothetical protein